MNTIIPRFNGSVSSAFNSPRNNSISFSTAKQEPFQPGDSFQSKVKQDIAKEPYFGKKEKKRTAQTPSNSQAAAVKSKSTSSGSEKAIQTSSKSEAAAKPGTKDAKQKEYTPVTKQIGTRLGYDREASIEDSLASTLAATKILQEISRHIDGIGTQLGYLKPIHTDDGSKYPTEEMERLLANLRKEMQGSLNRADDDMDKIQICQKYSKRPNTQKDL